LPIIALKYYPGNIEGDCQLTLKKIIMLKLRGKDEGKGRKKGRTKIELE